MMGPLRRAIVTGLLAGTAFLAAACGSGGEEAGLSIGASGAAPPPTAGGSAPAGPSTGPPKDACQVVTQEEVAATLGNRVRAGVGEGRSCFWATTVDKGTSVYLTVHKPAADHCNVIRNSLPKEGTQEPVAGIGSSAVWNFQQVSLLLQGQFVACWPDSVVWVTISGETSAATLRNVASSLADRAHRNL